MSEPRIIRLSNSDREIVMMGSVIGVLKPVSFDTNTSAGSSSSTFVVPLSQRPLIKLVTLKETSLVRPEDSNEPLVELDGNPFSEPLSVEQARAFIKELETACKHIESTMK